MAHRNSRLPAQSPIDPHTFLHTVNTSGVKTRPVLKKRDVKLLLIVFFNFSLCITANQIILKQTSFFDVLPLLQVKIIT